MCCACVVCMTSASSWPNCVSWVAWIPPNVFRGLLESRYKSPRICWSANDYNYHFPQVYVAPRALVQLVLSVSAYTLSIFKPNVNYNIQCMWRLQYFDWSFNLDFRIGFNSPISHKYGAAANKHAQALWGGGGGGFWYVTSMVVKDKNYLLSVKQSSTKNYLAEDFSICSCSRSSTFSIFVEHGNLNSADLSHNIIIK